MHAPRTSTTPKLERLPTEIFLLLVALAIVLSSGCVVHHAFMFRPAAPAVAEMEGQTAAIYPVPPERPQGEVRVLSFGLVELQPSPGAAPVHALLVRVTVANNGDDIAWTIDTRDQSIDIPGRGENRALYANTDAGSMPTVTINRGERRLLDLYFPVPGDIARMGGSPTFDFKWQVKTGERVVAQRTPFHRLEFDRHVAPRTDVVVVAGMAPFWWLHPHYGRHLGFWWPGPFFLLPPRPHRVHRR